MDSRFVQAEGRIFVYRGNKLVFNGIGIGSWLNMEHFMMGIPGTDKQIRKTFESAFGKEESESFFDSFVRDFITEDDFRFLQEHDIDLVRVPFNYRLFIDDHNPESLKSKGFLYIDHLMELASRYHIFVLLDLHTTPGGQNPDWHSDNGTGYTEFWEYEIFQEQSCVLWKKIAERYKNEEYLLGYDVLNEPFVIPELIEAQENDDDMVTGLSIRDSGEKLRRFYEKAIRAIREEDRNHIIFLEGDYFASDFSAIEDLSDDQLAMTFHFYPTVWYPDLYEDKYSRQERNSKFEEVLIKLINNASRSGRPILCGEAGYEIKTQGFDKVFPLIEDTLDLFRKYELSFTLWSYKDAGFMGMVYPKSSTPWMELTRDISSEWDHHSESSKAQWATDRISGSLFPSATKQEKYVMTFRQKAVFYPLEAKHVLLPVLRRYGKERLPELAGSFLFSNCDCYGKFADAFNLFKGG